MADTTTSDTRILLDAVPQHERPAVAAALARLFGVGLPLAFQMVQAAPIVLLERLKRETAENAMSALESAVAAGGKLHIVTEEASRHLPRVAWPSSPNVGGVPVALLAPAPGNVCRCPACGAALRATAAPAGNVRLALADGPEEAGAPETPEPPRNDADEDPLFSGVKPMEEGVENLKAVDDLRQGDTGFWHAVAPGETADAVSFGAPSAARGRQEESGVFHVGRFRPGPYAVVVPRTADPRVARLAAELLAVDEETARARLTRPLSTVARGVSREDAQAMAGRFRALGSAARVSLPAR